MPRKWPELWYDRSAQGAQRLAPWEGAPQDVHKPSSRRILYRLRLCPFFRSGFRPASSMIAHGAQRVRPSWTEPPHRVQQPAARLSVYCRLSAAWRFSRHDAHVVPSSTGDRLPQRMQSPASIRAFWRRLLLARPARFLASTSAPPYLSPKTFPAAYFARSEARLFSRHGSQDERPGAAGSLPHREQRPSALRAAASRRDRLRS